MIKLLFSFAILTLLPLQDHLIDDQLPVKIHQISENVLFIEQGWGWSTNISAILTSEGIVIVDTGNYPGTAKIIREEIETRLGAKACLVINTHGHWDHAMGNQAFENLPILAHENATAQMQRWGSNTEAYIPALEKAINRDIAKLSEESIGEEEKKKTEDYIRCMQRALVEMKEGYKAVYPTLTYADSYRIQKGDTAFELLYLPGIHNNASQVILDRKNKVLFVGDAFSKKYLPYLDENAMSGLESWLFKLLTMTDEKIETVIGGHGKIMSGQELRLQLQYIDKISREVKKLVESGNQLSQALETMTISNSFPEVSQLENVYSGENQHLKNIERLWNYYQEH
jgi:glyoxylase-like metal-dependent hydrolase (beta-lactamase superfamily II)